MPSGRSAAVDPAELDATVERVAGVVGAEPDDDLAGADAFDADARRELAVLPLEALLDHRRALLRKHFVGLRIAGAAGVADDLHARVARRDVARDLLQPEGVLRLQVGRLHERR